MRPRSFYNQVIDCSSWAHTPAPWHIEREPIPDGATSVRIVADGAPLAGVYHCVSDDPATLEANARLIAAAPDLLYAFLHVFNGMPEEVIDTHVLNLLDYCADAIEKATGK